MQYALIVDDSSLIRFQVSQTLHDAGYYVCEADNGQTAYEAFREWEFDLVITDLVMPVCDGLQLIEKVRRTHPELPIVVLSSAAGRDYIAQARSAGADTYLLKPLDRATLLARIEDLVLQSAGISQRCLA